MHMFLTSELAGKNYQKEESATLWNIMNKTSTYDIQLISDFDICGVLISIS